MSPPTTLCFFFFILFWLFWSFAFPYKFKGEFINFCKKAYRDFDRYCSGSIHQFWEISILINLSVSPFIYSSWIPSNKVLDFPVYKSYTFLWNLHSIYFLCNYKWRCFLNFIHFFLNFISDCSLLVSIYTDM